jgi:hypothetical protein
MQPEIEFHIGDVIGSAEGMGCQDCRGVITQVEPEVRYTFDPCVGCKRGSAGYRYTFTIPKSEYKYVRFIEDDFVRWVKSVRASANP